VNVGVIGCGQVAYRIHVPDFARSRNANIVGLCDIVQNKAKALAEQYAPAAKLYTDYRGLLAESEVEAVAICLPNHLHASVAIAALKAGKHVLVEKPMATSLAEGKRMIAAATQADRLLLVDHSQRVFGVHVRAREVLDSGMMGRVLHVHSMFGHAGPENWSPSGKWFFRKKEARWGAMADLGVHKADLLRWLLRKEIVEVSAYYGCLEKKFCDVDDNFSACLKFADGSMGTLGASWTAKGLEANSTVLYCENGTLLVNADKEKRLVAYLISPRREVVFEVPPDPKHADGSLGLDVGGRFARAVLGLEEPFCTGVEALKSLAVIVAAEKAADTGKSIKVVC
jgi:predicted dehydrogenase